MPVDDVGYIESSALLELTDEALRDLIAKMRETRYGGWRNYEGKWRDIMGLDIGGRDVLDWGCGTGMEALELARAGNRVRVHDVHPGNVQLALRVLRIHGYESAAYRDLFPDPELFDTFNCSGVLHHVREPEKTMRWAAWLLRPAGRARLMLYSDQGWRIATGTEPPQDVTQHPQFMQFVRFFDAVGEYADWYDARKLQERFGEWFELERAEYMAPDRRYLGAVLRRKSD